MASLTGSQHTSTQQFDGYLKGIRDEFDRLNHELEEARKERDEYITKYKSHAKDLRELRQIVSRRECQYCQGEIVHACGVTPSPLVSPVSSTSEYYSSLEEEDAAFDRLANTESLKKLGQGCEFETTAEPTSARTATLFLESTEISASEPGCSAWGVEFDTDARAALQLKLLHKLTQGGKICLAFSTDGKFLATASTHGIVCVFDSKTGKRISVMKDLYEKSLTAYECLGFSPDSKHLATGGTHGKVQIWIVSQRRVRNMFLHGSGGTVDALDFSSDGQCIASCSSDGTVRIWRLRDGFSRVLNCTHANPWSVRFSPDGRHIASGCNPRRPAWQMLIWNVRTERLVANWQGHDRVVASLVFTPDGEGLLSASWDKQVIHWEVAPLMSLGFADPPSSGMKKISRLLGHTHHIHTVSISPDGKWIASGAWDKTVRIWNAHDDTLQCILHCPGEVWSVDFSPVGNYLAIGGTFEEVAIWNYADL